MSNLDSRISLQMNWFHSIKTMELEAKEHGFITAKIQIIATKLELLDANWEKFDATHERLCKSDPMLDTDYHKTQMYD